MSTLPVIAAFDGSDDSVRALDWAYDAARGRGALLELVPAELAAEVTRTLHIPTVGIGAGPETDAQVLVWTDMLELTGGRVPKLGGSDVADRDTPGALVPIVAPTPNRASSRVTLLGGCPVRHSWTTQASP
jgi:nucleotide-binding universal stress UspA family protein